MRTNYLKALAAGLLVAGVVWSQAAPATPQGVITERVFLDIGSGTAVADLTGNAKFPNSPDLVHYRPYFELYATGDIVNAPVSDVYDNSGAQIVGYFYPPATGEYVFYICSDDLSNLYLSTDATEGNKKLIAQETAWSNPRQYTESGGSSSLESKCSLTFAASEWPGGGAAITLTANRAYYIEAVMKEGSGGDNLSVAVSDPGFIINSVEPIPGDYLSTFDKASGPAAITTQPQSQTVDEGQPVTFTVAADGTPPYTYDWRRNGAVIATTTEPSYTIARASRDDNGAAFSVVVTAAEGAPATSADAILTVNADNIAPTVELVRGSSTFTSLTVTFSEPVDPTTAQTAANYQLTGGVTVSAATLAAPSGSVGDNMVILTTSLQTEGSRLTLTVNNVKDVAGNTIAANTQFEFGAFVYLNGYALRKKYNNIDDGTGGNVDNLFADPRYPSAPDRMDLLTMWEYPRNGNGRDSAVDPVRNYFDTIEGYFIPPANGSYVFLTAGADRWWLYLSTDENPANMKMIAAEPGGWSDPRGWNQIYSGTLENRRSDTSTYAANNWPDGNTINLVGGKKYYMLEVHHDPSWCGADDFSATYKLASDEDPANGSAPTLTGSVIGFYVDPTGSSLEIEENPADVTQQESLAATFTVTASGSSAYGGTVSYQWQRQAPGTTTWADIAGATAASYSTPPLALADSGAKYRVVCSVPTVTRTSSEATLTVVGDTFAPVVEAAGAILNGTAIEVGVRFDENVTEATATALANYTLSKGSITGVRYQKFAHADGAPFFVLGTAGPFYGAAVVLTTSGLASGDTVTLTVNNIQDLKGNTMTTAAAKMFTVTSKMKWTTIGGNDILDGYIEGIDNSAALWPEDVAAYSEADFDVIGSGTSNWDSYDEATFVYEEVTGDFDKVVRVEYHDPTSQWARAGLCATPSADTGMARGGTMAKRFLQRANPAVIWNGSAGNNQYESAYRATDGGTYTGPGNGPAPAYPTAWMRMQRSGQTFNALYSNDGTTWAQYGTYTYAAEDPMPDTLLVGPYYCPEFGNNESGAGIAHSTVAKFRQYGSFVANPSVVTYGIGLNFATDQPSTGSVLPSISTAGAAEVLQGNWNNLTANSGTSTTIVADALGASVPTAVTVTWSCANTWASTGGGEENNGFTGNDKTLMTGYLDTTADSTTTVNITGIPADLTAAENGYDVYVYTLGGAPGRGGGYRITAADGTTALTDYVHAYYPANPTNYVQVVPVAGQWVAGTYIKFTGLTAAAIQVQATTQGGHGYDAGGATYRAPINAIQLVPSSGAAPAFTSVARNADGSITVTWTGGGTLQVTTDIGSGAWQNVDGAASPYTFTPEAPAMFGRIVK